MFLPRPDWPAPTKVQVRVTDREGGVSDGACSSFNLGFHVEDKPDCVSENRRRLQAALPDVTALQWVRQVHGTAVLSADHETAREVEEADAIYTRERQLACCIMTADCLPVCFSDRQGTEIAIAHAGWRGLAAGVLEATLEKFSAAPEGILAWLGPAIGPCHFEVGDEVKTAFIDSMGKGAGEAFQAGRQQDKWMADLYALARLRLQAAGLKAISGGGACTYCDEEKFYSYRRNSHTGRFATLIYLKG